MTPGARDLAARAAHVSGSRIRTGVLGLATGAGGVFLGRVVARGSLREASYAALTLLVPVALWLGAANVALATIVVAPFPMFSRGLGLPLTWLLVGGLAAMLIAERLRRVGRMSLAGDRANAPRGWRLDLLLPVAFLASVAVSSVFAVQRDAIMGVPAELGPVFGVLLFACILDIVRTEDALNRLCAAVVASAVILVVVAALQVTVPGLAIPGTMGGGVSYQRLQSGVIVARALGPIGDYEAFAEYLALCAVMAVGGGSRERTALGKGLWFAAAFVCASGVLGTGTRSGAVILAVGLLLVVAGSRSAGRFAGAALVAGLGLAGAYVASDYLTVTGGLWERMLEVLRAPAGLGSLNRVPVWERMVAQMPMDWRLIVGYGPGFSLERWGTYPHNLGLWLLITQGVLGLVAMMTLLLHATRPLFSALAHRAPWGAAADMGAVMLMLLIDQQKIEFMRTWNYQLCVWVLIALSIAARRLSDVSGVPAGGSEASKWPLEDRASLGPDKTDAQGDVGT